MTSLSSSEGSTAQYPPRDHDFELAVGPQAEGESQLKNEKLERLFFEVNTLLGGTSINVEMFDDDYKIAFNRSLESYRSLSTRSVYETYGFLSLIPGIQTYYLHEAVDNVVQIYRKRALFGSAGTGFDYFAQVAASLVYPGSQPGGYLGVASYDFALQYEETLNRLFARDMMFNYDPSTYTIYLKSAPNSSELIILRCYVKKNIAQLLNDNWSRRWLTQTTLGWSKIILGEKRSKFATLPGAQGGTQLNGERIKEEGKKILEEMDQEILDYKDGGGPSYPIMG